MMHNALCPECSCRPARLACGICWHCFFSRDDELDVDYAGRPPSPWPTDTLPGTPERVEVYAERAACGYALFHPADARVTEDVVLEMPVNLLKRSESNGQPPGRFALRALRTHFEVA